MKDLNYDEEIVKLFSYLLQEKKITLDRLYALQYRGRITMKEYIEISKTPIKEDEQLPSNVQVLQ